MAYRVVTSLSAKRIRVFKTKKETLAFYNKEVKKLGRKPGVVHIKEVGKDCIIKGKIREPFQKAKNIKPGCTW